MAVQLTPFTKSQWFDNAGNPLSGGKLFTFAAGTATPLASFTDSTGATPNANPVILDSAGRADVWLTSNLAYKLVLQNAAGTQLWSEDNINPGAVPASLGATVIGGDLTLQQATPATGVANQSSNIEHIQGQYWNGAATATDDWTLQDVLGTGTNPTSTLTLSHSGSSGASTFSVPGNETVGGTLLAKNIESVRHAEQFAGVDIGAKINAAVADLGVNGGTIIVPAGLFSFSTPINLNNLRSIIIEGVGGLSAGAQTATALLWTGAGTTSAITMQNALGIQLRDMMIEYNNAGFTGTLIDMTGPVTTAAYNNIVNCSITGAGITSAAVLVSLDGAESCTIQNCRLGGADVAIRGAATNGSFSVVNQVINCTFSDSGGNIKTAMIQNPTNGWTISGCTFELGQAAGLCKVLDFTGTISALGMSFVGNWTGDDNAAAPRTLFNWKVQGGQFSGNFISCSATQSTVFVFAASSYIDISGNCFQNALVLFNLGANVRLNVRSNTYSGIGTFMSGTPLDGYVYDNASNWTVYGSQKFTANTNQFKTGADATNTLVIQAGSAADQIATLQFQDKANAVQWNIEKDASNFLGIFDAAGTQRLLMANNGGTVVNSGNAASVVTINGSVNSGTGGMNIASGGGAPATVLGISGAGLIGTYKAIATAGNGIASVYGATSQKTESAADTNVLTFTPPAAVGSYRVRFSMDVSAQNTATLGWTATWTDSNGSAQAPTNLALFTSGVAAPALTVTAATNGHYYGSLDLDTNAAGTAIVVKLTFAGTSFTAKVSATVERLI